MALTLAVLFVVIVALLWQRQNDSVSAADGPDTTLNTAVSTDTTTSESAAATDSGANTTAAPADPTTVPAGSDPAGTSPASTDAAGTGAAPASAEPASTDPAGETTSSQPASDQVSTTQPTTSPTSATSEAPTSTRPTTTEATTTTAAVPPRPRVSGEVRVLIYTEVGNRDRGGPAYTHLSTPSAVRAVTAQANALGMIVTASETSEPWFSSCESLETFDVLVFLNTSGDDILNTAEREAMQCWATNPDRTPGLVGVHSAAESLGSWQWYGDLLGAYFNGHARSQDATLHVSPSAVGNPLVTGLPTESVRAFEEWYVFRDRDGFEPITPTPWNPRNRAGLNVILDVDENTYEPRDYGDNDALNPSRLFYSEPLPGVPNSVGRNHPIAWYQRFVADPRFGNTRSFYTALGHGGEPPANPNGDWSGYTDAFMLTHLRNALQWAAAGAG
jgi:type 1 glutamine amidotransferase